MRSSDKIETMIFENSNAKSNNLKVNKIKRKYLMLNTEACKIKHNDSDKINTVIIENSNIKSNTSNLPTIKKLNKRKYKHIDEGKPAKRIKTNWNLKIIDKINKNIQDREIIETIKPIAINKDNDTEINTVKIQDAEPICEIMSNKSANKINATNRQNIKTINSDKFKILAYKNAFKNKTIINSIIDSTTTT